ncbi:hypothetical protein DFJ74DRAFT_654429 [Hyaloraphidium curvatum]|nr:hypothetical protein DFJ74DRAFT_654429 [Hyaloraphidium curvatum]
MFATVLNWTLAAQSATLRTFSTSRTVQRSIETEDLGDFFEGRSLLRRFPPCPASTTQPAFSNRLNQLRPNPRQFGNSRNAV